MMKRFPMAAVLIVLLVALAVPAAALAQAGTPGSQTYTVLVGYENAQKGVDVMGFFPGSVTIHAGDTVHFVANSKEIHTVSFGYVENSTLPELLMPAADLGYPDQPPAPSPLVINPVAIDKVPMTGASFVPNANSGMMTLQEGGVQTFDLTFPNPGDYLYVCLVHGWMMKGWVHVVDANTAVSSPNQAKAAGQKEIAAALAQVPAVTKDANQQIQPSTPNSDGTMTHHVWMGYHEGPIDLMQFFPDKLVVRPGDTVMWEMAATNDAPHTVTFLNGAAGPEDFIPYDVGGKIVLYINPEVLYPMPFPPTGAPLTRTGIYSSGVMLPVPGTTFQLVIGDMKPGLLQYECLLHDESGMTGTLMVVPR
jgi:plastocyanin